MDLQTYVCIPCRFVSKYSGACPQCRVQMRGFHHFHAPKKRADKEWQKLALSVSVYESNIDVCTWWCCTSPRYYKTLSQYKAEVRTRLAHRADQRRRMKVR